MSKKKHNDASEEANAFLDQFTGKPLPEQPVSDDPLAQAQELVYDAYDAPSRKEAVALARQALERSEDCADAYVLLAEADARSPKQARDYYEKGVAAGERALGPEVFEEDVGHFWGILETRPYMRARQGLAEALWRLGQHDAALEHYRALLRFRQEEEGSERANEALDEALEQNPHVPAYLLGKKKLPKEGPAFIGFGDENEALDYARPGKALWRNTYGALRWLSRYTKARRRS